MIGQVLRLLEFETSFADIDIDRLLQEEIAPRPADVGGLSRTLVGRYQAKNARRYLVATVWDDHDSMEAAVRNGDVAVYQAPFAPYLGDAKLVAVDLDIGRSTCGSNALDKVLLILDEDQPSPVSAENAAGPHAVSPRHRRRPCLILSANAGPPYVVLAGWTRGGEAGTEPPMRADALVLLDRIDALSQSGIGIEYQVLVDHARSSSP